MVYVFLEHRHFYHKGVNCPKEKLGISRTKEQMVSYLAVEDGLRILKLKELS
jgi:hypothetical protein